MLVKKQQVSFIEVIGILNLFSYVDLVSHIKGTITISPEEFVILTMILLHSFRWDGKNSINEYCDNIIEFEVSEKETDLIDSLVKKNYIRKITDQKSEEVFLQINYHGLKLSFDKWLNNKEPILFKVEWPSSKTGEAG